MGWKDELWRDERGWVGWRREVFEEVGRVEGGMGGWTGP